MGEPKNVLKLSTRVVSDNEKELEDENYTQGILLNSDSRNNLGVRSDI
jgi:hypothetical protein